MSSATDHRVLQETTAGQAQAAAAGSGSRAVEQTNVAFAERATVAQDAAATASSQVGGSEGKLDTQGYLNSAKSLAGTAFATAQSALSTAQQTVQPHLNAAAAAAQPHVEAAYNTVRSTVEPHLTRAQAAVGGGVPSSSAPLESGAYTTDSPYPPVDHPDLHAKKIGNIQNTV